MLEALEEWGERRGPAGPWRVPRAQPQRRLTPCRRDTAGTGSRNAAPRQTGWFGLFREAESPPPAAPSDQEGYPPDLGLLRDFRGLSRGKPKNGFAESTAAYQAYPEDSFGPYYKPLQILFAIPDKVQSDSDSRVMHCKTHQCSRDDAMGEVHKLIRDRGRDEALRSDHARSVVDAAAAYMATEDSEIGFLYSGWCQAALPHKRLPDDAVWQIRTDHVTLLVQPGHKSLPEGDPVPVGVPYGSRARLILLYLQSEALRTQSREIELGRSMNIWLRRMGIPVGGKSMRDVRDQAERISRCRMTFQVSHGARKGLINQSILDTSMFVEDDADGGQGTLLLETARLSETFYEQLKRHPVPVEEAAIKQLANNSMALDLYCWLAYRLHCLETPKLVSWKALHGQFGRSVNRLDHFRTYFRVNLELAQAVYPDAKLETSAEGLLMHPSRPPVGPKLVTVAQQKMRRMP